MPNYLPETNLDDNIRSSGSVGKPPTVGDEVAVEDVVGEDHLEHQVEDIEADAVEVMLAVELEGRLGFSLANNYNPRPKFYRAVKEAS